MSSLINLSRIQKYKKKYREDFLNAKPFPVLIIDNFLSEEGLENIDVEKLNTTPISKELSSDFLFAKNKIESPNFDKKSKYLEALRNELLSDEFKKLISYITDKEIFLDPSFTGGGIHQGGQSSFLEMHADFSRHPVNKNWIREFNLLLYLNKDWKKEWKGSLKLRNLHTGHEKSIDPIENRLVIMLTKSNTLHGYEKINFPEGRYRTSIAAYAYSIDDGSTNTPYKSTQWVPEGFFKNKLASISNSLVPLKQKFFGSRTAKRAKKN